ncbi:MAG TPA: hypothetical protein VLD65_05605 [Anaerolineales bacterium]|nr:hypothetical protein [Anaerolineales bacterium]
MNNTHTDFKLSAGVNLVLKIMKQGRLAPWLYLDGANHWTAFRRLALPLAMPAIASLGIFQFL